MLCAVSGTAAAGLFADNLKASRRSFGFCGMLFIFAGLLPDRRGGVSHPATRVPYSDKTNRTGSFFTIPVIVLDLNGLRPYMGYAASCCTPILGL